MMDTTTIVFTGLVVIYIAYLNATLSQRLDVIIELLRHMRNKLDNRLDRMN